MTPSFLFIFQTEVKLFYNVVLVAGIWYLCIYTHTHTHTHILGSSLVPQMVKNLPAMQETLVWSLCQEDPLEKGMANHFSILGFPWWLRQQRIHLQCRRPGFDPWVGKIPWKSDWNTHSNILAWRIPWAYVYVCVCVLGKEMATHSSILNWKIPWTEEPGRP